MLVKWDSSLPEILEPLDVSLALSDIGVALNQAQRVVCMIGAGASTSAGIQDFRSSAGLYSTGTGQAGLRLTSSQSKAMFSASCYSDRPSRAQHWRFMASLKVECDRVASRRVGPVTNVHGFMRLLKDRGDGSLLRVYSQNIDGFEAVQGLSYVPLPGTCPTSAVPGCSTDVKGKKRAIWQDGEEGGTDLEGDCVQLHGSIAAVRCSACPWVGAWLPEHTRVFARGKTLDCPACQAVAADRKRQSKRTTPLLSYIRPALLLYDEHSPASEVITTIAQRDLDASPDLLLVCGTSLKIPGFRALVKQFSAEARKNGGLAIFVNREQVGSEWDDVFDYHVLADCDSFVSRVLLDWGQPDLLQDANLCQPESTSTDDPFRSTADALLSPCKSTRTELKANTKLTPPRRGPFYDSTSSACSSPASQLFSDHNSSHNNRNNNDDNREPCSTPATSQTHMDETLLPALPLPPPSSLSSSQPRSRQYHHHHKTRSRDSSILLSDSDQESSYSFSPLQNLCALPPPRVVPPTLDPKLHEHEHVERPPPPIESLPHVGLKRVRHHGAGRKKKAVLEAERAAEAKKLRRKHKKARKLRRKERAERKERRKRRAERMR